MCLSTKMMYYSTLGVLSLAASAHAAPMDWNGIWSDEVFGGKLQVCVSLVNSVYYAQGTNSELGYMRGTIDASDVWTGNFYLQGLESRRGTFSLTLSQAASNTFAGVWTEKPSVLETFTSTGVQESTVEPPNFKCFKADDSYLTTTDAHSFSGYYTNSGGTEWWIQDHQDTHVASYIYDWGDAAGTIGLGHCVGTNHEKGQVMAHNWYEQGSWQGIEMLVAKNATSFYLSWWFVARTADWTYCDPDTDDGCYHAQKFIYNKQSSENQAADDNFCSNFDTTYDEDLCVQRTTVCDGDDDDVSTVKTLMYPVLAFSAIGMVAALVACGAGFMGGSKAPMAGSEAKL